MRARYYSPDMRRFVNADIVAGKISNAVTLNRFAYANGNPVSFIDPFGLSVSKFAVISCYDDGGGGSIYSASDSKKEFATSDFEKSSTSVTTENSQSGHNYTKAIYVVDKSHLKTVGHSQIYFIDEDGSWYKTEYTGTDKSAGLKGLKSSAKVVRAEGKYWDEKFASIKESDEFEYTVLNGDFNNSYELVVDYYNNQRMGEYHFLFNNCSDYVDALLDVATINGQFTQSWVNTDPEISVPIVNQKGLEYCSDLDRFNMYVKIAYEAFKLVSQETFKKHPFGFLW
jgi:hypothetical protein